MSDSADSDEFWDDEENDDCEMKYNDSRKSKYRQQNTDSSSDDQRGVGSDESESESEDDSPPTSTDEEDSSQVSGRPSWVAARNGTLPAGAVEGASNARGPVYVARCKIKNKWFPATLIPSHGKCYAIVNRKICDSYEYQVLCYCQPKWITIKNKSPPPARSLPVDEDEKLYIGRVQCQNDSYTKLGLVSIKNGICYAIRNKKIRAYNTYEILTLTPSELDAINKQGKGIFNSVYNALPSISSYKKDESDNSDESSEDSLPSNKKGKKIEKPSTSRFDDGRRGRKSGHGVPSSQKSVIKTKKGTKDIHWVKSEDGNVPKKAVMACENKNGPIYVARIQHKGSMLPGKLIPRFKACFAAYNGEMIKTNEYEVLCIENVRWKGITRDRTLPKDALIGGWTDKKKHLYIGRVKEKSSVGMVREDMQACFVVYGNQVNRHKEFEILVVSREEKTSKHRVQHRKQISSNESDVSDKSDGSDKSDESDEADNLLISFKEQKKQATPIKTSNHSTARKTKISEESHKGSWVLANDGEVPMGAIVGGRNHIGDIYVARGEHDGEWIPGKLIPSFRNCFLSKDGQEFKVTKYEVLCDCDAMWVKMKAGDQIPADAIPGGLTKSKEILYIGHVIVDAKENIVNLGKVEEKSRKCFVLSSNQEYPHDDYEILVLAANAGQNPNLAAKLTKKFEKTQITDAPTVIDLSTTSEDYQLVSQMMNNTIKKHVGDKGGVFTKYDIIKIERIWNRVHYRLFEKCRKQLEKKNGTANMKLLFHGTPKIHDLWKSGFDERYSIRAGMFGAGIYFAEDSSKSNQYIWNLSTGNKCPTHQNNSCYTCERQLLVCEVLLGKMAELTAADTTLAHAPVGFDSVKGVPGTNLSYAEYIVYRGEQAFPKFLVTYKIVQ